MGVTAKEPLSRPERADEPGPGALRPIVFGKRVELLGMVTMPSGNAVARRGAIVCAPLLHQNITSYRPLRTLAGRIAASGRPVLRFDWPGCGDSADATGSDPGWIEAVHDAVEALRAHTGVEEVALVGFRAGAMLATVAALEATDVSELVLLAPFLSGRTYLRELRAFQALALDMFDEPAAVPVPLPAGALETSGFVLGAAEVAALGAVDLAALDLSALPAQRALVVTSHPERSATAFAEQLVASGLDVIVEVRPELAQALDGTNHSIMPRTCSDLVTGWLRAADARSPDGGDLPDVPTAATLRLPGGMVREQAVVAQIAGGARIGVLCEPATDAGPGDGWVVFLNAAKVRRIGPNRLWTSFARHWAERGTRSFRFDVHGVGDSDGDPGSDEVTVAGDGQYYDPRLVRDVVQVLDWLAEHHGAKRFAVVGLCSGATWAYQAALDDERVSAVVMINPRALFWDENGAALKAWSEMRRVLRTPRLWRTLVRRGVRWWATDAARGALLTLRGKGSDAWQQHAIRDGLRRLAARGASMLVVFSENDKGLAYFERHLGDDFASELRAAGTGVELIRGPDHTFRPVWSHAVLGQLVEARLAGAGYLGPAAGGPEPHTASR